MPTRGPTIGLITRTMIASDWTTLIAFVVMSGLHLRWLLRSAHAGDVLSAYGAGLVVLGVLVAARPFIRAGVRGMAEQAVHGSAPQSAAWDGPPPEAYENYQARVIATMPDVWAERVVAVVVVVVGTLLNGWGTPLARRWGLPV